MRAVAALSALVILAACTPRQPEMDAGLPTPAVPTTPKPQTTQRPDRPDERTRPEPGEVVYYRLHPNWRKVDKYCGAFDRSYVVKHVHIPPGAQDVLNRAVGALLSDYYVGSAQGIARVSIEDGMAVIDLRSVRGLGIASTTCGGVSFTGSLMRTVFQFDSIDSFQIHLAGSCRDFAKFKQAAGCITVTRDDM